MGASPHGYRLREMDQIDGAWKNQSYKEKIMIKPEIAKIPDQSVLFVRRVGAYENTPPDAWKTLMNFAKKHHPNLSDAKKFSIAHDDPNITEQKKLRFDACITASEDVIEKGEVGRQTLKGGKYAVFLHRGPYENLDDTFDIIFQQWYPKHKNEVTEESCFCEHLNMELMKSNPKKLITKIYVPLK